MPKDDSHLKNCGGLRGFCNHSMYLNIVNSSHLIIFNKYLICVLKNFSQGI